MTSNPALGKRNERVKGHAAGYVVPALAALILPAYFLLERAARLPIEARDHAVALGVVVLAVLAVSGARAWRGTSRRGRVVTVALHVVALAATVGGAVLTRAHYALPDSSPTIRLGAPLVSGKLVDAAITDENGARFDLAGLRDRPTLLVWFRGTWCPYCVHQLEKLAKEMPKYGDRVRVVAVTWDPPEQVAQLRKEAGLPFTLLSDPDGALMTRCELMHCVAVLDAGGVVRWGVISGNWRTDIPEEALLQRAFESR